MIKLDGYEIILGSSIDPQFGPVLLFGMGGQLVEVFKDRALALPPLTTTLARRMMEQTKIYTALQGVRGRKPVNLAQLEQIMVRFSQLVAEQHWIQEIDINPMLAGPDNLIALDARVVVFGKDVAQADLPKLAIQPYPRKYVREYKAKNGETLLLRPIRPEDEPAVVDFHHLLSERTVYLRYLQALSLDRRVAHERLTRICFIDYDREMALVAERTDPATQKKEIIGVGRLQKLSGRDHGEFSVIVTDKWQGTGLGTELLYRVLDVAREEKLKQVTAFIHVDNPVMQHVCEKLGFQLERSPDDNIIKAVITF
jgi:acetyltransferase